MLLVLLLRLLPFPFLQQDYREWDCTVAVPTAAGLAAVVVAVVNQGDIGGAYVTDVVVFVVALARHPCRIRKMASSSSAKASGTVAPATPTAVAGSQLLQMQQHLVQQQSHQLQTSQDVMQAYPLVQHVCYLHHPP